MLLRTRTWILGSVVLSGLGLIAACSSPGGAGVTSATDPSSSGAAAAPTAPAWAKAANYRGRVDGASAVSLQVHLALHDLAAAKADLEAMSDPANARYGQFLSDDEFSAKYAPTEADVAAVRAHLEAHGLQVTDVPVNRAYLSASGSAAQVESAFGTRLGHYQVGTELRRAPMDPVSLPAAVSSRIGAVLGLATPAKMKTHTIELSPDATTPACAEYTGQTTSTPAPAYGGGFPAQIPVAICGYKPAQLRRAYGLEDSVRTGNDGHGQKIAIVDAWTPPTLVQDAQTYAANEDADYPLATSQITLVQGPGAVQPPNTGWYGESSLDVEAVHAMAPGAQIVYVGAASDNDPDLIAAVNTIVTKHLATVVSNSYDGLEAQTTDFTAWESMAVQAGLKGIGLYYASGDNGDESQGDPPDGNGGVPTVDFPASLPEVTAVGGTSLGLGATGEVLYELGWEDAFSDLEVPDGGTTSAWTPSAPGGYGFGAGGGISLVYLQPSWQKGIVPSSFSTYLNAQDRVVPDVAMLADPYTGFLRGRTRRSGAYGEGSIGGTSLATPLFTATVALAQQHAGRTFGFANPLFYKASKKGVFRDVAPQATPEAVMYGAEITTFDFHGAGNTNFTAAGYDNATGLGVPNGTKFLSGLK
ncbi:MAG TPA: S53 family peptidase [Polyangiaceae bacterium]